MDYIKLEIIDHLSGHAKSQIYEGTWDHVEKLLRHDFAPWTVGVEEGNLRGLLRELDRAHGLEMSLLDGEVPPHMPHLHPVILRTDDGDDSWRK